MSDDSKHDRFRRGKTSRPDAAGRGHPGDQPLTRKPGTGAGPLGATRARFAKPSQKADADGEQRVAKAIARAGLCSRRDAEAWIEQGRVMVNGEVLTSPALNVRLGDRIVVDGKPLAARQRTRLFLFYKPRGYVTTARDPEGRSTVFDILPSDLPRLISVGRLDINTEGLLLLTNDGGLARTLELPATAWLRRYRVRAKGAIDQAHLDPLSEGITIDGMHYAAIEAKLDRVQGANVWLTMGLREGKNREVKKVLEQLGLAVNRLIRISFGPFQLGALEEGGIVEVKTRILKDQLGEGLAAEAGVDFDGPSGAAVAEESPQLERGGERPAGSARTRARPSPRTHLARQELVEDAPRRDRPEKGKRKHISVLRAERRMAADEPRKRIEKTAAVDRKGRAVTIERIIAAKSKHGQPATRNARRFAKERDDKDTDGRQDRDRSGGFAEDRGSSRLPRVVARLHERPPRPQSRDGARAEFGRSTQAPRRPGDRDRASDGKPYGDKRDNPSRDRPWHGKSGDDRSGGGKSRRDRSSGSHSANDGHCGKGAVAVRKSFDSRRKDRPHESEPVHAMPRGDKPFGGRPPRGKAHHGKSAGRHSPGQPGPPRGHGRR